MLDLDSKRWANLQDAYGSALNTPKWIRSLEEGNGNFGDAWSNLCHQLTVYSATFAAAPYIYRYALSAPLESRVDAILLLGIASSSSAVERDGTPEDILNWFHDIIPQAAELALSTFLGEELGNNMEVYLLEAVAALHGFNGKIQITELLNSEFSLLCPSCEKEIWIYPSYLNTQADKFVAAYQNQTRPFSPADVPPCWQETHSSKRAFDWLYHITLESGYFELAKSLRYLFGTVVCLNCAHDFKPMQP